MTLADADKMVLDRMLQEARKLLGRLHGGQPLLDRIDADGVTKRLQADVWQIHQAGGFIHTDERWHHLGVVLDCLIVRNPAPHACRLLVECGSVDPAVVLVASGFSPLNACEAVRLLDL